MEGGKKRGPGTRGNRKTEREYGTEWCENSCAVNSPGLQLKAVMQQIRSAVNARPPAIWVLGTFLLKLLQTQNALSIWRYIVKASELRHSGHLGPYIRYHPGILYCARDNLEQVRQVKSGVHWQDVSFRTRSMLGRMRRFSDWFLTCVVKNKKANGLPFNQLMATRYNSVNNNSIKMNTF